jgi:hypothetical protein
MIVSGQETVDAVQNTRLTMTNAKARVTARNMPAREKEELNLAE